MSLKEFCEDEEFSSENGVSDLEEWEEELHDLTDLERIEWLENEELHGFDDYNGVRFDD